MGRPIPAQGAVGDVPLAGVRACHRCPALGTEVSVSSLVYRSAHGISNIPSNIRRIFPSDRLSLAGRQSTSGLERCRGGVLHAQTLTCPQLPTSDLSSPSWRM
eukprot:3801541-Pyramimonas_sp.AAC.2